LTGRERLAATVTDGIAACPLCSERGEIPESAAVFGFMPRAMPEDLKSEAGMEIVDEVFDYASKAHS